MLVQTDRWIGDLPDPHVDEVRPPRCNITQLASQGLPRYDAGPAQGPCATKEICLCLQL